MKALTVLEEALGHAERLPLDGRDQHVVTLWTRHYILLGEHDQALQSAQRALAEGQHCQDDTIMGMAAVAVLDTPCPHESSNSYHRLWYQSCCLSRSHAPQN
jgi:hypothetical protein